MRRLLVTMLLVSSACAGRPAPDTTIANAVPKTLDIGPLTIAPPGAEIEVFEVFRVWGMKFRVTKDGAEEENPFSNWARVFTHSHGWEVSIIVELASNAEDTSAGFSCLPKVVPEDCEPGRRMVSDGNTEYEWKTCRSDVDQCLYEDDMIVYERVGLFFLEHRKGIAEFDLAFQDGRKYEVSISLFVLPKYRVEALAFVYGLIDEIHHANQ